MSFDIFFHTGRFSGEPVVKKNTFTGKPQTVIPEEPLTAAEVRAVRQVLRRVGAQGPDEYGCYVVGLEDGGGAEVFADKLKSGCMVSLRGITPDLTRFLFDFLKAGNWVMLPAMEDAVAITTSPGSVKGVPDDFPRIVACDSADEVGVLLTKGVKAWQGYRDQVAGGW
jgi:hypothetical protein